MNCFIKVFCFAFLLNWLTLASSAAPPGEASPGSPDHAMALIREWVHGYYDNQAQADADFAANLPDDEQHRLMYQLFAPVSVPGLKGHLVFQQSSTDGSLDPDWIIRLGLLQFFIDPDLGVVRQRELSFKEPQRFQNAHQRPEVLTSLHRDDVTFDAGCDFLLQADPRGDLVAGNMPDGSCRMFNQGIGKPMVADDRVEIRADQFAFRGRWVDEDGNLLWGTASSELNQLVRRRTLAEGPPAAE
jgi:hypothetical protein